MTPAHACDAESVVRELETSLATGLSSAEAEARLETAGPNTVGAYGGPRYGAIAVAQVRDPLVALLVAAAAVSAAIGESVEAAVIGAIVVLNAVLGFVQEAGAERAILALRRSLDHVASVVRDGREQVVPVDVLVPGDLLVLREGERVAADARVVAEEGLEADESALTGESLPVEKQADAVDVAAPLAEQASMVFAGTAVTRGRGRAVVTTTGQATELGSVARLTAEAKPPPTPLQRKLAALSRAMVALGVVLTALLAAGMLLRGASVEEAFLVGVAVAVAAVPEGLAAVVTIALAQGAQAMARKGAIVRRLSAIETLGEATVIATDKTGTLTLNEIRLAAVEPAPGWRADDVVAAGALASTAGVLHNGQVVGDPVDAALVRAALERGLLPDPPPERVTEVAFDPRRRRMAVVYDGRLLVKGAPEVVLPRCEAQDAEDAAARIALEGLKVLAVAERRLEGGEALDDGSKLTLVGLVGLQDTLRPSAAEAVRAARQAGIEVVMLTGDHPATAASIGRAVGLPPEAVHARVTPAEKLRLVEGLQARGEIVAVTGDGINDAPALRRADVGVAMGRGGTEAAREASAVVLTDDDFGTIVGAVGEGRRVSDNLRSFVAFLLSANLGEVVLFAIAILAGLGAPMTVVQVLTVNLLTDGLPAVALSRDPAAPRTMRRPPRALGTLFGRELSAALAVAGLAVGLAGTVAYLLGRASDPQVGQTMAFSTIALAELALVFSVRSSDRPAWRGPRNPSLLAGVAASAGFVALVLAVPGVRTVFGAASLGSFELGAVVGLALAPAALVELAKWLRRLRG